MNSLAAYSDKSSQQYWIKVNYPLNYEGLVFLVAELSQNIFVLLLGFSLGSLGEYVGYLGTGSFMAALSIVLWAFLYLLSGKVFEDKS